jgi:hypothetical protein
VNPETSSVSSKLKKAKQLLTEGAAYDSADTYFDIQTGENRTLTFYFN